MRKFKATENTEISQKAQSTPSPNYPPKQVEVLAPRKKKAKKVAAPPPKVYTTITL